MLRVRSDAIFLEFIWQPVVEQAGVAGNLATQNLLPCMNEDEHLAHNLENNRMARWPRRMQGASGVVNG